MMNGQANSEKVADTLGWGPGERPDAQVVDNRQRTGLMTVVVSMGTSSQTSPDFWSILVVLSPDFWSILVVLSKFPLGMSLEGSGVWPGKTV